MAARTSWRASSLVLASAIFVYRNRKQKKRASLIDEKKNLNSIPKRKASLKMQNSLNTNERLKTQIVHME